MVMPLSCTEVTRAVAGTPLAMVWPRSSPAVKRPTKKNTIPMIVRVTTRGMVAALAMPPWVVAQKSATAAPASISPPTTLNTKPMPFIAGPLCR